MSDYTSNPSSSRPGSPVGSLRDVPARKQSAPFRFQWDQSRPGPGSVFSDAHTDFPAPRIGLYGASTSTTNLGTVSLPEEWSSAKHGFNAISTVVNNPHKKSAPPKAHAPTPAAPAAELPRVRRKDFDAYLRAVGPEWDRLQRSAALGTSGAAQISDTLDLARPPVSARGALPPLSSVPDIFFAPGFALSDARTFAAVSEVVPSEGKPPDAHAGALLEQFSRHADTLEQHLVHEIARRAAPFFAALSNLQDLQAESAQCLSRIGALRAQLADVGAQGAARGLRGVAREARLSNVRGVQEGVRGVEGVIGMTRDVRGMVDEGRWNEALDGVDRLMAMWDGPVRPEPISRDSLASVEEDDEDAEERPQTPPPPPPLAFPLSALSAFATLPTQLQALTADIATALTADAVGVLRASLAARIYNTPEDGAEGRLGPLIHGVVRTGAVRAALGEWRSVARGEMGGIVKTQLRAFEAEEDADPAWAKDVRAMSHAEFMAALRAMYGHFLAGLEGMQALNEALLSAMDRAKSDKAPVDLPAAREDLADALAAAAEHANALASRVLAARAEQVAALELPEFVLLFRETWNFFVRCEVVCRRMLVSLRGVISGQAKTFLQAFHQARISQAARLVEDEQWQQADVAPELQRTTNLIVDAAVRDPAEFVLELGPTVAPPSSPLPTRAAQLAPPAPSQALLTASPPASPRARANGSGNAKHVRIEERAYFAVAATQQTLRALTDYLRVIVNLPALTTDTVGRTIEFLKAFNSRTCQVVLGAGAMRSAGLKNITAKHLALASQSLSIMVALIPYVRETFRRHLAPKQAVMLVEFDKLKRDYQEHQNEIHAKLIAIMGDRLAAHVRALHAVDWAAAGAPEPNDYMRLLVKETVTLHKVLARYLASAVVEHVMSQVFAAINHRLSEAYTALPLPDRAAKNRLLADARFLKDNFSALKAAGGAAPGMLEIVVSELPLPGDAVPASPLPLPPANVSLASPRPVPQQKRASLFAGDRIRGMLSRSPTLPAFGAAPAAPAPEEHPAPRLMHNNNSSATLLSNNNSSTTLLGVDGIGVTLGDDSAASLGLRASPPPPELMAPPKDRRVGFRQVAVAEEEVAPAAPTAAEEPPPPPTPEKDGAEARPLLMVAPPPEDAQGEAPLTVSPIEAAPPGGGEAAPDTEQ